MAPHRYSKEKRYRALEGGKKEIIILAEKKRFNKC